MARTERSQHPQQLRIQRGRGDVVGDLTDELDGEPIDEGLVESKDLLDHAHTPDALVVVGVGSEYDTRYFRQVLSLPSTTEVWTRDVRCAKHSMNQA